MLKVLLDKIGSLATGHLGYLKGAFSDNGMPSSSRFLTIPHSLTAIGCAIYMTVKTGGHPDPLALTALGGFATVHYAVNRASNMLKKGDDKDKQDGNGS